MKRIHFTVINDLTYDQRMHRICNSLVNNGFKVKLIGRKLKKSHRLLSKQFDQKRITCIFNRGKLFYLEYNVRLFFYLLFQPFDIICACDLDTILPALFISKIRNKKRVYDAHEYFTEVPEVVNRPMVKKIWEIVGKFSIPKMHKCYTVSDSLAQVFQNKHNQEFETILNLPVASKSIQKNNNIPDEKFILYQGAINKGRGLELLIKAVEEINISVKIAGEGDITDKIKKLVLELDLKDKIEFLGWISPDELIMLTPKAYIGYNLLETNSLSYYYSLSNKFFNYIHAEIPSISSNFPEYKNINNKIEVSHLTELNLEKIKSSINILLENQDYYQRLKTNCLKAKELYNWQNEEKKLLNIYHAL